MSHRPLLALLCALPLLVAAAPVDDPLAVMEREAAASGRLAPLQNCAERALSELLYDPAAADAARVVQLETAREFGRYFAGIPVLDDESRQTLAWLADRPILAATLLMAVTDADRPEAVLAVLTRLRVDHGDRAAAYPDLAAALCVVWDDPPPSRNPAATARDPAERASGLFHFYSRAKLRADLKALPWPLAVYVADNSLAEADIAYALRRYGRSGAAGGAYSDVPCDSAHLLAGAPKKLDGHEYTLENLAAYGGACDDQAYYAAGVDKSLGLPAVYISGVGGNGGAFDAWVGTLDSSAKAARWDFSQGRPAEQLLWSGEAVDPQTRATLSEADVAVLAEVRSISREDRLASWAMAKAADLVPHEAGPAATDALLGRAITLCPGNRLAWETLADAAGDQEHSEAVFAAVRKFAANDYPEFALNLARRLIARQPAADQLRAWANLSAVLPARRPDLRARVRVERAGVLRQMNRPDAALAEYGAVLTGPPTAGPAVLLAAEGVDELLRGRSEFRRLASIYDLVLRRLPKPPPGAFTRGTPYLILGNRYAELLDALGEPSKAAAFRRQLKAYDTTFPAA